MLMLSSDTFESSLLIPCFAQKEAVAMDDEAEILNERLRCSCASFSIGAIPFPIDPLCSLVGTFLGSGTMKQASPLVEDIDLVDEMITIRNPSKALRDISGYKISDDQGHNVFYFHEGTCIEPEGVLYLYCCAKNETSKHHVRTRLEPHVQWTNKDGSNRMKNVLNDDGDKISLFNSDGIFVSSCEKAENGEVSVKGDKSGDIFPMSKMQIMSMINMYLCYWRITMVICMYMFTSTAPILFLGAYILSLVMDSMTRSISCRSNNCNYLFTGLATICDFFLLLVLYNAMDQASTPFIEAEDLFQLDKMSYLSFMKTFLSAAGKVMTPEYTTKMMRTFLVVDLLAYGCHLFSLLFSSSLEYYHVSEKYMRAYPKMTIGVQILQSAFVMQHYGVGRMGTMPLMDSMFYSLTLSSFLFMRLFNCCIVYSAIRLWTENSEVELSDVGEELDEYLRLQSPAPMLDSRISFTNPRRISMASTSSSPASMGNNTPTPRPVARRHAASVIRSNIRKKTKPSSSSNVVASPSEMSTVAATTATNTAINTTGKSNKRKSVTIESPQATNESHVHSEYSPRDGLPFSHTPSDPYILHDEEEDQLKSAKKKVKKSVSIQEDVRTPSKSPSSNSTKGRKKTPAAKSK